MERLPGRSVEELEFAFDDGEDFVLTEVPIPTKKIVSSELMTIKSSPKDADKSIVRQVIVMGQEKGLT